MEIVTLMYQDKEVRQTLKFERLKKWLIYKQSKNYIQTKKNYIQQDNKIIKKYSVR